MVLSYWWSVDAKSLSRTVAEILSIKHFGSRPWPFRVTWRHRSRDHWNRRWSFPIGRPLTPCPYLVPLPRYWASNIFITIFLL